MKKLAVLFCLSVFLFTSAGAYSASCYSPQEFEAEQGLRIHSELMVIALTCMKMPRSSQMYDKYQAFTRKNHTLISGYEDDIIAYYRKQGAPRPEEKFHSMRTGLANQISQHAISMSTSSFCQHFGARIDQALSMDQSKLRRWARQPFPQSPTSRPACMQQARH